MATQDLGLFGGAKTEAKKPQTVEAALNSALGHLRDMFDEDKSEQDRAYASNQYQTEKKLIVNWMGDRKLAGVGRQAIEKLTYAENRMWWDKAVARDGEAAVQSKAEKLFPAAAQFKARYNEWAAAPSDVLSGRVGTTSQYVRPMPTEEERAELLNSGDPFAVGAFKFGNMVSDGKISGGITRTGFFGHDNNIEVDDELAEMPSGWDDPDVVRHRENVMRVLYGRLKRRDDGEYYATLLDDDGSPVDVDIPNLSNRNDIDVTDSNGQRHTIKVTEDLLKEVQRARQGGAFDESLASGINRLFHPNARVETMYGQEILVPNLTGNSLLDQDLARNPVWQRAIMDSPEVPDPWWNAGRQLYGTLEFAAIMLATQGVGTAIATGGRAVAAGALGARAARAATGTMRLVTGTDTIAPEMLRYATRQAGAMAKAAATGSRSMIATRIPGTYYDARQIAEEIWYNAVTGVVNGHWDPGQWIVQGWNEGVSEYVLGSVARASRAAVGSALSSGLLRDTSIGRWYREPTDNLLNARIDPVSRLSTDDLEYMRRSLAQTSAEAARKGLEDGVRRGLIDQFKVPMAQELIGSLYDSAIVGLGFGMYQAAHKIAAADGRTEIELGDMSSAIWHPDAWGTVVGTLLGHGIGVGASAVKHRDNPYSVKFGGGLFGLELNPEQKKFVNDIAQHAAFSAEEAMKNPAHAKVVMEWFENAKDTNLDFHYQFNEIARSIDPSLATPEPISGNGVDEHVKLWRSDPEGYRNALRYESNAGLDRMYTRLDSGRPGHYPGDWNATIRDIKDAIIDRMQRNINGEPHGQMLTGQKMSDRDRRAKEKSDEIDRRYEIERKAYYEQMQNVRAKMAGMVKHVYARQVLLKKQELARVRESARIEKAKKREAMRAKKIERIKKALAEAGERAKRAQDRAERRAALDLGRSLKRIEQEYRRQGRAERLRLKKQRTNDRLELRRAERLARMAEENAKKLGLGQKILEGMPDVWHGGYPILEWNPKYMNKGAGDQWQGWGLYTGEERKVGEYYKGLLSERFEGEAQAESGIVDVTVGGQSAAVLYQGDLTSAPNTDLTISLDEIIEPLVEQAIDRSGQEVTDVKKGDVAFLVLDVVRTAATGVLRGGEGQASFTEILNSQIEQLSETLETYSDRGEDTGIIGPSIDVLQDLLLRGLDAKAQPPTVRPTPTINRGKLLAPKDRFLRFYESFGENTEFVQKAVLKAIASLADAGLLRPRMQIEGLRIEVNIEGGPPIDIRKWMDSVGVAKPMLEGIRGIIYSTFDSTRLTGIIGSDRANALDALLNIALEIVERRGEATAKKVDEHLFDHLLTLAHSSVGQDGTFDAGSVDSIRYGMMRAADESNSASHRAIQQFVLKYRSGIRGKELSKAVKKVVDESLRFDAAMSLADRIKSPGITFKSSGSRRVGWSFGHGLTFTSPTWIEVAMVTSKGIRFSPSNTGADIYKAVAQALDEDWDPRSVASVSSERASKFLLEHGIRGTVYADALTKSKPESEQTMNRVLFDLKDFVTVEHNDAPITSAQMQVAAERIVNALETHPQFAHLQGDPAALVQHAIDWFGGNPNSFSEIAKVVIAAEEAARANSAPDPIKLRGQGDRPIRPSTPATRGELIRQLWSEGNQAHFNAGREVLSPSMDHGSDYGPLGRATAMGAVAALQAQFGTTSEIRELGRAHQFSLAAGIIVGSGLKERSYTLAAAVSGLTPADMQLLEQRLAQAVPAVDEFAQDVIDAWNQKLGFEVISARAMRNPSTKQVLRLIAMGGSVAPGVSTSDVLGGDLRSHEGRYGALTKITKVVMETVGKESASGTIVSSVEPIETLAQKAATAQLNALDDAIKGLPKSGLRGESLWLLLKKRVAYATTGDQWADTEIGNSGWTPRKIVDGIVAVLGSPESQRLQQQPARVRSEADTQAVNLMVEAIGQDAAKRVMAQSGVATETGKKGQISTATAPDAVGTDPIKELNETADKLVSALAEIRKLSTDLNLRGMDDPDTNKRIVAKNAPESELRRAEAQFFRRVADGHPKAVEILQFNAFDPDQIEDLQRRALSAQGRLQEVVMRHVAMFGFTSESDPETDLKTLKHLFEAIKNAASNVHGIEGEARELLDRGGWLDENGRLKENSTFRLSKIVWQSLFDASRMVIEKMADGDYGVGQVELEDFSSKIEGVDVGHFTMFYAFGLSYENLRLAYVLAGDFIFGYYEEHIDDYPWKGRWEPISPDSVVNWVFGPQPRGKVFDISSKPSPVPVSMSAMLDYIGRRYPKAGPIQGTVVKWTLSALQNTVSGKSRGVMTSEVRKRMKAHARADAGGRVEMHQLLAIAESTLARVSELNLSTAEFELIGRAVSHGLARDIQTQERWNKIFGDRHARLWPVIQELNRIYAMMAQKYVDLGLMSPERAAGLLDSYFKQTWVRVAYDEKGRVKRATPLGGGRVTQEVGDFEHARTLELDREDMRRIFDVRYVFPTSMVEAANRLRLFRTIKIMLDNHVHWTREEYDNAPDIEKFQARRAAVASTQGEIDIPEFNRRFSRMHSLTGVDTPELIEAENDLRRRELEREIRDQRQGSIYSAMVYQMIQRERLAHTGEDKPEMTEEMKRLLDTLETCYLPVNALKELGFLIDQTEVGGSINQSQFTDFVSKMSLEWRRTHTIFRPRHWGIAHISNFVNMHIGGKVPMHDILDPMGFYSRSARALLKYQDALKDGYERVLLSNDRELQLVHWFMLRSGGSTFASSLGHATNGHDWLAGWLDRVSTSMSGMAGRTMSDTVQAALADRIALAQTSLTRANSILNALSTANSPEGRAEILRELIDEYGYLDMLYKYAGFLRGMRLGMSKEQAYDWATEATGDFNDLNPTIRGLTSTFGIMRGSVYTVARQRTGKGARIGTAVPGAPRHMQAVAWAEHLKNLGVGGPYWGYNFLILPAVGRFVASFPWKGFTGVAAFTGMAMAMNAMAGGDDDDRLVHAGDPDFMHLRFDEASFDAYRRRYGKQPMWGQAPWVVAVEDWFRYGYAALKLRPEGKFLFRSRGPDVGGRHTEIDWTRYMPGVSQVTGAVGVAKDLVGAFTGSAGPQGSSGGLSETSLFFMPLTLASLIAGLAESAQGVMGQSRKRTIVENVARAANSFSAPMGGPLPWWMSREGLFAAQHLAWGNRTPGEHIDNLPPDLEADPADSLFGVAVKTLLPLRNLPSQSAVPGDEDTRVQGILGIRYRQPQTGSYPERLAATHGALSKEAILDGLTWAYNNAREYGAPPQLWFSEALGLEIDIVKKEEGGTVYWDVVDDPKTRLGQFIRNSETDPKDRRALARKVYTDLIEHRDALERMAGDPEGLIYNTAIPTELFARMARGVWNKGTNSSEMVKLVWREATDKRIRADSGGKYDAVLARIWNRWGLDAAARENQGTYRMWEDMQEFLKGTAASYPDQNQTKVRPQEVKEMFGAKAWDLFPEVMNKRPEYSFMRGN